MLMQFTQCLSITLGYEGGDVNNPKDSGGHTNFGITQKVYDSYRLNRELTSQSVSAITYDEVQQIYYSQYWQPIRGDDLPVGLSLAVFDYAVNSGVSRAVKDLQRVLNVSVDGQLGEVTCKAAIDAVKNSATPTVIDLYCQARLTFMRSLSTWATFGKGWQPRVEGIQAQAVAFAQASMLATLASLPVTSEPLSATPAPEPVGKAVDADVAALKTSRGRGIAIILAGCVGQIVHTVIAVVPANANMDQSHGLLFGSTAMLIIGTFSVLWNHIKTINELRR
jgi:lysozyme family protein